jgi:anti-sigma factor RsiW
LVLDRAFVRASLGDPERRPGLRGWPRARGLLAGAGVGAAVAVVVLVVGWATVTGGRRSGADVLGEAVGEAVNDHLRVVASTHPVEIEGGGIHQVRPWFTGRLDFAPPVTFSGDADFPLVGGSVGYFHEHKAAVFSFRRRLHAITLLVLPSAGLDWPERDLVPVGPLSVAVQSARGFTVLLWRDRGFGYVLVSDVNRAELERLATLIDAHPRD